MKADNTYNQMGRFEKCETNGMGLFVYGIQVRSPLQESAQRNGCIVWRFRFQSIQIVWYDKLKL